MPINVSIDLSIKPERMDEFIGFLRNILPDTRRRTGFQSISVHRDQERPGRIFVWERWDTKSDQESYFKWRAETGFTEALGAFVESEPVVSFFDDVEA